MKAKKLLSITLALTCFMTLLTGCGSKAQNGEDGNADSDHPVITMNAPYRNMSTFYDLVHEKYPEVNLEIAPYNGQNTTQFFLDMRIVRQPARYLFLHHLFPRTLRGFRRSS